MAGNTAFDTYRLSEDHEAIREAVREVATDLIEPYAAAVDEEARYPREAHEALVKSDFFAPHIPEEYDGVGADALATCIVIEEVARADASASLIPAVNKLGTMPLLLGASEEVKQRYLPPIARGETTFPYGLSEREAGSDTASMRCRAKADGDDFVLSGQKSWITNAGESEYYTVLAVTDPDGPRGNNITAFVVEKSDEGFDFGEKERKLGIKGSPTRELHFDNCRIPGDRMVGNLGEGLKLALRTLDHTRVTIGAQAVGIAQAPSTRRWPTSRTASSSARRSRSSRASSSCSPTWRWSSRRPASSSTWRLPSPSAATPTCRSSGRPPSATPPTSR
jgi:alkylation response protein AidB-like acyl-CoA dehydrogenase